MMRIYPNSFHNLCNKQVVQLHHMEQELVPPTTEDLTLFIHVLCGLTEHKAGVLKPESSLVIFVCPHI